MNTQHIMATTLIASTLFTTVSAAHAQTALRSDTITAAQVAKGYILPHRSPITNKNINLLPAKQQPDEKALNRLGFTLTNPKDVWTATPNWDAAALAAQFKANQAAAVYQVQSSANTIYDTLYKDWEAGDKSIVYGQVTFDLTHSANVNMARLQGDAQLNAALLGNSANLAEATADFYAPATGAQSATMNLTLMGQTIWSKSNTGATEASINDGFNWNGKLWQIGFDFSILDFGVSAEVWVQGSVGAAFGGYCVPNNVNVTAYTTASLAVDGRAAVSVPGASASLDANLTLADVSFISTASTSSSVIKHPFINPATGTVSYFNVPVMNVKRTVDADLNLILGSLIAKGEIFGLSGSYTFINAPNGLYQWGGVLDNYSKTYDLQ